MIYTAHYRKIINVLTLCSKKITTANTIMNKLGKYYMKTKQKLDVMLYLNNKAFMIISLQHFARTNIER